MHIESSPAAPSSSIRRRALAACALALPLLLAACAPQTDDGRSDTAAAQPESSPESSPAEASQDASSAEQTAAETQAADPSETADTTQTADGSACADDAYDYVLLEQISCEDAQEAVRGVVDNGRRTAMTVEDGQTACMPGSGRWTCTLAGEQSPTTIELEAKDPEKDPLAEAGAVAPLEEESAAGEEPQISGLGTYAENVDAECVNDDYEFADVSGLDCAEVDGLMQSFLDEEVEGTMDDVRCTQGTEVFDDGTKETWSCIVLSGEGGSFIAYGS